MITTILRPTTIATALLVLAAAAPLGAQNTSRPGEPEFRWSGAVQRGEQIRISNISGDVRVTAVDGDRVELVATRRGGSGDEQARVEVLQHANGLTICALHGEDWNCDADGPDNEGRRTRRRDHEDRAYYDFEVRVPRRLTVNATSVSGDVAVTGTTTPLRASSVSGDIRVERIRATRDLEAKSVSGDVVARLDAVAQGTDIVVTSVSGDVTVSMPRTTGFELRMSTVSGELESDFPLEMRGRFNRRRIEAQVNNGGSDLRVNTVSGDVRLSHNN